MARLIAICGLGVAIMLMGSTTSSADNFRFSIGGFSFQPHRSSSNARHGNFHDDLRHNDFHRQLYHRDAHRYPMTHRSHDRLHDNLEHDAFHDQLKHRSAHRSGYFTPYRSFGISGRNYSVRFGW